MQFKHPEFFYAFALLIIPIIVHLFHLRRFEKVEFTNVKFLKQIVVKNRKSSQLKKWLVLLTRMLALTAIIIAFAQPYTSKLNKKNTAIETVIYVDNSFSMQAKGEKGELFKRAIQNIISTFDNNQPISIYTNNAVFKTTSINTIKNDLLKLNYSPNQLKYENVFLKGRDLFTKNNASQKHFIAISDFQQKKEVLKIPNDSSYHLHLVKLTPVNPVNTSIDSLYISKITANTIDISAVINNSDNDSTSIPVSLYGNDKLVAKSTLKNQNTTTTFTIPNNTKINGKVSLNDAHLQFDNTFYFNINTPEKINVLAISNNAPNKFLKRIYTTDEFNLTTTTLSSLNYNVLKNQNLIVLNELENLPIALTNSLLDFTANGGYIAIIPSEKSNIKTYNQLTGTTFISELITNEKKITSINYAHPIFKDVFTKQTSNFQYPKVNSYFKTTPSNHILSFENKQPFLLQKQNIFIFTAALNSSNSNFKKSPLIVPTFYNIAKQSLQLPKLYYSIGNTAAIDIKATLQQNDILKLTANQTAPIIPQQQHFTNKIKIYPNQTLNKANIYEVSASNGFAIKHISFNYKRDESLLNYYNSSAFGTHNISKSLPKVVNSLKSDLNINALWKWFIIFALIFLCIEMLILKYFK